VKFIKRESTLKTLENKGLFQRHLHIFSTKDGEGKESLGIQVVIYLK
jgi:hypothetical protein